MFDSKKILQAITKARADYKKQSLDKELLDSTQQSFWESQADSEDKKQKLIRLAKENAKRPVKRTDSLGNALCNYTLPDKPTYDPDFTEKIQSLAPHWFKKTSDSTKEELIALAKSKAPKPSSNSTLYKKLTEYTNKKRSSYDAEFDSNIKKLAPDWFVNTSKPKKMRLLDLAKQGARRPRPKTHELGYAMQSYSNPSSNAYDPEFIAKLKKLAPKWFRSV